MPFQEKSAWVMSLALLLGSVFYFGVVAAMSEGISQLAPPTAPVVAAFTVILVVAAILGHVAIAVFSPKDASEPLDEREREIFHRAGHVSGNVFGIGAVTSLGIYLLSGSGTVLFYGVFISLIISQLAEYGIRIFLYRCSI